MLKNGAKVFGHWTVDEKIGSGAFGTVYKLKREEFGTEYLSALKVISIPPENTDSSALQSEGMTNEEISTYYADIAMSFMEEIKLLEDLKGNSNIVSYEDHIIEKSEDGMSYTIMIRMELLTPLKSKLKEGAFSREDVLQLGIDICNALELCEKKKIIHRDIKPDNIFISNAGTYKLGDFGVARTMEKTVAAMSQKGTYSYMAPEVFVGKEYNQNVDLYSLGILLYQLLNKNRTPFLPDAPSAIKFSDREEAQKRRMAGEPLPRISSIPDTWNDFLLKVCHPDPEKRYQNASDMKTALQKMLEMGDKFILPFKDRVPAQTPVVQAPAPSMQKPVQKSAQVPANNTAQNNTASSENKKQVNDKQKKQVNHKEKKQVKNKEYFNWLKKETTSLRYTLFFAIITFVNAVSAGVFGAECEDIASVASVILLPVLLIVKLINFILAATGKNGFLKRIPLYMITFAINFLVLAFCSLVGSFVFVEFCVFGLALFIPVILSVVSRKKEKPLFIASRIITYITFILFSATCGGMWCEALYVLDILGVLSIVISLMAGIFYPIVANILISKKGK